MLYVGSVVSHYTKSFDHSQKHGSVFERSTSRNEKEDCLLYTQGIQTFSQYPRTFERPSYNIQWPGGSLYTFAYAI